MEEISKKFGQNLRRAGQKKKMSQGDIALKLGIDRAYICNIEQGKINPTLATMEKLARTLEASLSRLSK